MEDLLAIHNGAVRARDDSRDPARSEEERDTLLKKSIYMFAEAWLVGEKGHLSVHGGCACTSFHPGRGLIEAVDRLGYHYTKKKEKTLLLMAQLLRDHPIDHPMFCSPLSALTRFACSDNSRNGLLRLFRDNPDIAEKFRSIVFADNTFSAFLYDLRDNVYGSGLS